jgi:hypothetical protein
VDDDGTASLDVLHRLTASIDTLNSVVRALAARLDASEDHGDHGAMVGAHRPTAWVPPSLPS